MSVVITQSATLGPFKSIEALPDRLRCDGTDLPLSVIGSYEVSDDDSLAPPPPTPAPTRDQLKAQRDAQVAAIQVTTSTGRTFDGDETSQNRMVRAITALQAAQNPEAPALTVTWVLADNSAVQVTARELAEALVLAGQAQAAIWVIQEN